VIAPEEFRSELRAWLDEHAAVYADFDPTDLEASRKFRAVLWDAGFLGLTLDPAYGGRGLTDEHQRVFADEIGRFHLPATGEAVTTGICAPTLLDFGSEDQKRHHIPRMLRGDEVWTQLLSEPGAGSDLAGLQTKAVRDGDEYVLTGQKVWTSGAATSDYALCVARTDPELPKHQGISMFIVDLRGPGVTIRPLRQMTGDAHFNEVFLDDVRLAADALVGELDDGWRVAVAMLANERVAIGAGGSSQQMGGDGFVTLLDLARTRGCTTDPVVRQELADVYARERILELMGERIRAALSVGRAPGPEGSVAKLATALLGRRSSDLAMAMAGAGGQAWSAADGATGGEQAASVLFVPMLGIAGGTSEIQRNIIGERVLGLPKDPVVDRDVPFRELKVGTQRV
jgi:alkylation response protein AidB-like acyl-CoA dehydrogenase